ncbi:MAG: polyphosphate polymerase domain-containing protein [Patescibacteria group bacterium]
MLKPSLHFQRFEFKYYLPKNKADKIIPALLRHMNWDPYIAERDEDYYYVNSLYFDSPTFGCFFDKESGVADRKKLRYRFYNDISKESPIFLEIKRKRDALVVKDRVSLNGFECQKTKLDQVLKKIKKQNPENKFLDELIWFKCRNSMRPKLFVRYKRKAFIGKLDSKLRVTFDYDIKTQKSSSLTPNPQKLIDVYKDGVVIELKYNNILPNWLHGIIQQFDLGRLAYSKYCNSLRYVYPYLDDNNYSPY